MKILIVDDHQLVREGLTHMLHSISSFNNSLITAVESGEKAINAMNCIKYDLAIIDYQLSGIMGDETTQKLISYNPKLKVLAISNFLEISCIKNMIASGASGYITKGIELAELMTAINNVVSGVRYFSADIQKIINNSEKKELLKEKPALSKRENQVMKLIASGKTSIEIARLLFVSKRTIDIHRHNLLKKFNASNTAMLINIVQKSLYIM
jgi:DNA-binding NarL/FixJ family response regulator